MACAEAVEDFGYLNDAPAEAKVNPVVAETEVDPAPHPEAGEGSLAGPASTVAGGGSSPATVPTAKDPPKAAMELVEEDPMAVAGSSQVA
jgi:ABC-type glycerol-3-phosphate transport system substrate-binding protein